MKYYPATDIVHKNVYKKSPQSEIIFTVECDWL